MGGGSGGREPHILSQSDLNFYRLIFGIVSFSNMRRLTLSKAADVLCFTRAARCASSCVFVLNEVTEDPRIAPVVAVRP